MGAVRVGRLSLRTLLLCILGHFRDHGIRWPREACQPAANRCGHQRYQVSGHEVGQVDRAQHHRACQRGLLHRGNGGANEDVGARRQCTIERSPRRGSEMPGDEPTQHQCQRLDRVRGQGLVKTEPGSRPTKDRLHPKRRDAPQCHGAPADHTRSIDAVGGGPVRIAPPCLTPRATAGYDAGTPVFPVISLPIGGELWRPPATAGEREAGSREGAALDIVVTVKQVLDPDVPPSHFRVDEASRKVVPPAGSQPIMNGYDANALEEALRLKEQHGGKVMVVTVGGDSARDTLKRAIAMGADSAVHVNDPALLDGDSFVTAQALAAAIGKMGSFDLVLSGRQASDTDAGLVHQGVAVLLGLPVVSPVQKIEAVEPDGLVVHRIAEDGYERVRVRRPAVLGVSSELNEPRYPPLKGIMAAGRAQIPVWTAADLGLDSVSARVELRRLYVETREAHVELIQGETLAEAGANLADVLREARLV